MLTALITLAGLYQGQTLAPVSVSQIVSQVKPGQAIVVSEVHSSQDHHKNQIEFLKQLATASSAVSVGLEFFYVPDQPYVDQYLGGQLQEGDFLKAIKWPGNNFGDYRDQANFPKTHGGKTVALNAPRALTGKIAKVGLAGLTDDEKKMLPPHLEMGSVSYFERFKEIMGFHIQGTAMQRYFEAQSVWDDTMAYTAAEYLKQNPTQVLVIIVGDFHAAYSDGLPFRLKRRGIKEVTVISQVEIDGLTPEQIQLEVAPHPKWGPRGDYVWVSH